MMYYVYILKGDIKHYIGYTSNIEKRLVKYQSGSTKTTKTMGILKLIGYFVKETKTESIVFEKKIKKDGHIERRINHQDFVKFN